MLSRIKFDIVNLFTEMLNNLPDEIFKSTTTTFVDVDAAGGQSYISIKKKLLNAGHSEKNIKKRVTMIFNNSFEQNYAINKNGVDCNTEVNNNIMKNTVAKKFDVITINPAYEGSSDSDSIKTWNQIVYKCGTELLNDGGYILADTPRSVLNSSGSSTIKANKPTYLMQKFLEENTFISYDETANEYFDSVEANVCSWIIQKTPAKDTHKTKFVMEDGETLYKKYIAGEKIRTTNKDNIISKVTESAHKKYKRHRTVYTETEGKNGIIVQKEKTAEFSNPVIWNTSKTEIMYSQNHIRPEKKLAINNYKDFKVSDVNLLITTKDVSSAYFSIIDDNIEKLQQLLTTKKLFQYVGNNFINSKGVFLIAQRQHVIPKLDLLIDWTDDMLYVEFKLTNEEINEIENWCEHSRS